MKIAAIFSPKNVLIAFVALTIFHIIVGQTVYVRGIEALLLSSFFLLSQLAIFVISIINCNRFYKRDKRQFVYSVIPFVVYGSLFVWAFVAFF